MDRLSCLDNFDELNKILISLVNEGMISKFYISKSILNENLVKSVTITSDLDFDYVISFENIKSDYREHRLNKILLKKYNNKI